MNLNKLKVKVVLTVFILFFLVLSACNNNNNNNENNLNNNVNGEGNNEDVIPVYGLKEFNECLADNGMVIYGSVWCPACNSLVEYMGGKEAVKALYVECTANEARCVSETKTNYIPEIQINGEVYEGPRSFSAFSDLTGCEVPNQ